MSTTNIKLTNVPIQITTGTEYATVQSIYEKPFKWCDSATTPTKENFHYSTKLNIGVGASIWIWNPSIDDTNEMNVAYSVVGG